MKEAGGSHFPNIAIRTILILQMAHTLLLPLIAAFALGEGVHPPGKLWTLAWILAFGIEVALLLQLSRRKNWVWSCASLLLIDACVYAVHDLREFAFWLTQAMDVLLLISAPIGFAAFWFSRRAFFIGKLELGQIVATLVLASCIVLVDGRFLCTAILDWVAPVPMCYVIFCQIYQHPVPQEGSLVLCWVCYAVVAACFWTVSKIRSESASSSPHGPKIASSQWRKESMYGKATTIDTVYVQNSILLFLQM